MNQRRIAFIGIVLAAVVVAAYYCMTDKKENSKVNIGRSDIRIEDGRFARWLKGRVSGVILQR